MIDLPAGLHAGWVRGAPLAAPLETLTREIPVQPGGYAIELRLEWPCTVAAGRLGRYDLTPGTYVYLGSARGPGGLRARLGRHLRDPGAIRFHWHIDYLRPYGHITALAWLTDADGAPADLECLWSQALARLPGARVPVPGFGATDCRLGCPAHLVRLAEKSLFSA